MKQFKPITKKERNEWRKLYEYDPTIFTMHLRDVIRLLNALEESEKENLKFRNNSHA